MLISIYSNNLRDQRHEKTPVYYSYKLFKPVIVHVYGFAAMMGSPGEMNKG
jgi:hypothetical protein